MNPCVVTFTSSPTYPGLEKLAHSCASLGWNLNVVTAPWRGFGARLKAVLNEADKLATQGITHVVHVDAFDVIAKGPPSELAACLEHYGNPALLLAAEANCWPDKARAVEYPLRKSYWWFAHSQFVVDLTQPRPWNFGNLPDGADDQRHLHELVLLNIPGIVLDRDCLVVQSIAFAFPWQDFFEHQDGRIRNKATNSLPLFIHGNGKTDMSWV